MNFVPTTEIVARGIRKNSASDFFDGFKSGWDAVRGQVLKLETRQTYWDPDDESWQAARVGDWDLALTLLRRNRASDDDFYKLLRERKVDFIRCRPVVIPMSAYLEWEFAAYDLNAAQGERIFCCNRDALADFFDGYAKHDFMVFDARFAFVHDYDEAGEIRGGWILDDQRSIRDLLAIHAFVKANSQSYSFYRPRDRDGDDKSQRP